MRSHLVGLAHFLYEHITFLKEFLKKVRSHLGEPARLTGRAHLRMNSLWIIFVKNAFSGLFLRKVQEFSSDRKILMSLLSVLFHLQNHVSVFWNFNFKPRYLGKRSLCPRNQPHFWRNSDKSLLSPEQNNFKKIWDTVL